MESKSKVARSSFVVGSATLASRLFGLIREQTFAYLFGAGTATDAFIAAFRLPNLLRDLFAEGALSAAFVPVFTDHLLNKGKREAFRLANLVINGIALILALIIAIAILLTPYLVRLIAPGFSRVPGKAELTALLAQIMFPFLLFISLAAISMGMLNTLRYFGIPALAPVFLNLGMILAGFFISPYFSPPIIGMAIGVLLGGLGQWLCQLPTLFKEGYRYQPIISFQDPGFRKILILMTPAVLGLASTQINIFVNTIIASLLPEGSPSYLNYSFRLMHFPLGVFGIAVATVTLPIVSAYATKKDVTNVLATCRSSLELVAFLTLPSTLFLIIVRQPLISVLYEHGRFTYEDTIATSQALLFYAFGLFFFAATRVVAQVFYSFQDTKTPVKISFVAIATNIFLNLILMKPMSFRGLALATSLSAMVNFIVLSFVMTKKYGSINWSVWLKSVIKILIASGIMGAVLILVGLIWPLNLGQTSLRSKIIYLASILAISALSYAFACSLLKIKELGFLWSVLKKSKKKENLSIFSL
ncbi:MAG: murein biosynthesis integral membrane protein MurJ [Candidatus Aminicenantes bacterium]|nr:murein biosynthesis integral membrane protein MurJ [Candidatus Aminicenantes bacterium]